jgi:branched-chain amino acid transport system substrate-binding protein
VQVLLSPLSGDEGIAVKNFSKSHPELTFINAASGAQETTFPDPSPNFFRYNMDGAQWQAGLGDYAYKSKGFKKIATVGEDRPSLRMRRNHSRSFLPQILIIWRTGTHADGA